MAAPSFDRRLRLIERESTRATRNIGLDGWTAFGVVSLLAGMFLFFLLGPAVSAVLLGVGVFGIRVGAGPRKRERTAVTRMARVVVTDTGVAIDTHTFIRRDAIAQAYFQPRPLGQGSVRCLDASGTVILDIEVQNEEEGTELLQALGRDVTHGRARFVLASPLVGTDRGWKTALAFGVLGAAALSVHGTAIVMLAAMFLLGLATAFSRRVDVGVDGLLFEWLGTKKFIAYDKIASVEKIGATVKVVVADGGSFPLLAKHPASAEHGALEQERTSDALFARIEDARARFKARTHARDLAERVTRGVRAVPEWRADLARMSATEEGGYRDAGTRKEDLWRVVEDAGAPEDARAGAAVALRKEDGAGPRLRVAAEAVASPHLRVALETAADPAAEDAVLDEALEALERRA